MPQLLSKDRRTIYIRRIKGFWEEFRRNKIGFVGLLLFLMFLGMALFAPWLTPYDPLTSTRVAESFAEPEWMRILPQYSDYPSTMEISPRWEVESGSEFVLGTGKEVVANVSFTRGASPVDIYVTTGFNYPYTKAPLRYIASFEYTVTNVRNVSWAAEMLIVNPNGTTTLIWYEPYNTIETSIGVDQDSYNYWLLQREGDPKAKNLARQIFSDPVKGDYQLILHASLVPDPPEAQIVSAEIAFERFEFFIPGLVHGLLGADFLGTDVLSQVIYGSRISLMIGLMAAAIATSIGILVGTVSGYLGGAVDEVSMRIVDILLCLPFLPLLLTLVKLYGKNVFYIVLFIAIFGWLGLSRVIRSQILYLRETAFVECAKASGASKSYIMLRHLIPNIVPVALASLVLSVPAAVLSEAGLSFLGFGDPRVPTWGKMLNYAFGHGAFEAGAWWWALPPGLAITFLSLSFVFMGFAIDEIVNPRLRRRR